MSVRAIRNREEALRFIREEFCRIEQAVQGLSFNDQQHQVESQEINVIEVLKKSEFATKLLPHELIKVLIDLQCEVRVSIMQQKQAQAQAQAQAHAGRSFKP